MSILRRTRFSSSTVKRTFVSWARRSTWCCFVLVWCWQWEVMGYRDCFSDLLDAVDA